MKLKIFHQVVQEVEVLRSLVLVLAWEDLDSKVACDSQTHQQMGLVAYMEDSGVQDKIHSQEELEEEHEARVAAMELEVAPVEPVHKVPSQSVLLDTNGKIH